MLVYLFLLLQAFILNETCFSAAARARPPTVLPKSFKCTRDSLVIVMMNAMPQLSLFDGGRQLSEEERAHVLGAARTHCRGRIPDADLTAIIDALSTYNMRAAETRLDVYFPDSRMSSAHAMNPEQQKMMIRRFAQGTMHRAMAAYYIFEKMSQGEEIFFSFSDLQNMIQALRNRDLDRFEAFFSGAHRNSGQATRLYLARFHAQTAADRVPPQYKGFS